MDPVKSVQYTYQLIDIENPVFRAFALWSIMLIVKLIGMSFLTVLHRFRTKTPLNPEDISVVRGSEVTVNDDVERVRRAHLNDMENILPYILIGIFYVLTDPNPTIARVLFLVATAARFVHTFVYAIYVIPQPTRAIAFLIHIFVTLYMALMCFIYYLSKSI